MPELLVVPHKRCGWLLNEVEDASQNQQVKQPCNDANQTIGLANITAKSVALYVCFRSVGMPTSDPYPCGAWNAKPHTTTTHDCQQVLDEVDEPYAGKNVVELAANVQIVVEP